MRIAVKLEIVEGRWAGGVGGRAEEGEGTKW